MTDRVRFLAAELEYGCHRRSFELPDAARPVVLVGPNGAGKTTLVEGLVRTLFGFNRRDPADRDLLASRRPWEGESCRGGIDLLGGDGRRWRIERDLENGRVELRALDGEERWSGDGNPAASNQEACEYRRRLGELFGLEELDHYRSTAYIVQGGLVETRLREELLQIAAGGYGNVGEALARLEREHREITLRPLETGGRSGRKPQELERVESELERLGERLEAARTAFAERAPIRRDLDRIGVRAGRLDREIGDLEEALGPLSERRAIEARIEAIVTRRTALLRVRRRLEAAAGELRRAAAAAAAATGPYPEDFLERSGRIQGIWSRRVELEGELARLDGELAAARVPSVWTGPAAAAALLLAGIGVRAALPEAAPAAAALVLLGLAAGLALAARRATRRRVREARRHRRERAAAEIDRLAADLARELEGVPGAAGLSPETIAERKREFTAWKDAAGRLERARRDLEGEIAEADELLAPAAAADAGAPPSDRAGARIGAVEAAVESCRTEIAKEELRLEGLEAIRLPEEVEPSPAGVRTALDRRRRERRECDRRMRSLEGRLLREGSGGDSPVALSDRIEALERRRRELERRARTHETAWRLVRDAYESFRGGDQDRLLTSVSSALAELSGGALGPIEAPGSLADARIRLRGRLLVLESPPLSYGELHAALFGIRLGASDFLARSGVRPPLIVDEPFAYLDLGRARELWRLLGRVATERQVIVLTQEELTLEALGVGADLELGPPGASGA